MQSHLPQRAAALLAVCCFLASCKSADDPAPEVEVTAYVMPKCAFSATALSALIPAIEMLDGRVHLRLEYVAKTTKEDATSPYGDEDLLAARYQLCAQGQGEASKWLRFLSCQNADWRHAPENSGSCAHEAGLDFAALQRCAHSAEAKAQLRASLERSSSRKIEATPTLFVDQRQYAKGRTRGFFSRELCAALHEPRPESCAQLPEPIAVPVTILGDPSCTSGACAYRNFVRYLDYSLEGAEIIEIDQRSPMGENLLAAAGSPPTPLAVFAPSLRHEADAFARLTRAGLVELADGAGYVLSLPPLLRAEAMP